MMVENNKRIKMKAANKKMKKRLKQKQQQKQVVTQNVKVVVGSKPRAKSAAPRSTPAKQPNIISISMPQQQQPPATKYYVTNMNEAKKKQQQDYTRVLKNPLETSIRAHQNEVEEDEDNQVQAGILSPLVAEPRDTSRLTAMLAARLRQQRNPTPPQQSPIQLATPQQQSPIRLTTPAPPSPIQLPPARTTPATPLQAKVLSNISGQRDQLEELMATEDEETRSVFPSTAAATPKKAGGAGGAGAGGAGAGAAAATPRGEWSGESKVGEKTKPDLARAVNRADEIARLRNLDLTDYRSQMTTTGDRIYKVASALGINYTVNRKRMSVETLRPLIEAMVGRQSPVIHRGKEAQLKGRLDFK